MSEERIDIVVTDKVDPNAAKNIEAIASAADRGQTSLKRLQSALAAVNTSSLDRLAAAMSKIDTAQAKLINSQARLASAQNQGAAAAQKTALAQQKVATETARTEAAQARAAAATTAAESAAMRLAAAQQRAQGASAAAANATQQAAGAANQARTGYAGAAGAANQFAGANNAAAASANNAANASQRLGGGLSGTTNAHHQYARAARQTTAANANIIAQIQDIGVSLAGGQNPLLVMIQQGSQLSYIASTMEGGVSQLIKTIAKLVGAWLPVIAVLGAVVFALDSANDKLTNDAGIKDYVKTLGLTRAELKKLEDQHVTMGDRIKAVWQVLSEDVLGAMGFTTDEIANMWSTMTEKLFFYMKAAFIGIRALTRTLVDVIFATVKNIPKIFYNAGVAAKNLFLMWIEFLVNKTVDGINAIGGAVNALSEAAGFGKVVGKLEHIDLGVKSATDGMMEMSNVNPLEAFQKHARTSLDTLNRIDQRASEITKKRLKNGADELIADRTPRAGRKGREDKTAENRAQALLLVNNQLDNELSRMQMLKPEREIQQRMDQIEQSLLAKKIKLTDEERVAIQAKVKAVEDFKPVQAEMDRIYQESIGPQEKLNATVDAATRLYDSGKISLEQYTAELFKATQAFESTTDPLFKFKEQLRETSALTGKYGVELEKATYLQSIDQEYRSRGLSIYDQETGKLNAKVAAMVAENNALREKQFLQSQLSAVLDPILTQDREIAAQSAVYAELDRLREADLVKEDQYQRAKAALAVKYNEYKLGAAGDFFSSLAQVTKQGHGVVGAISKAAAVAEATIAGYVAVQKALASAPPPWNYIAAAAVAIKTGAQVAGIVSTNVGSYATGGQFMVQGKSGIDANNINMNVTKGERVTIETPAQQRANDSKGANVQVMPPKVVNLFDERSFIGAMDSEDGEEVIMNIIRRRRADTNQILGKN